MQQRHADRKRYFEEQRITTRKFVIPFIQEGYTLLPESSVLEIGCGEGGNIEPFLAWGCPVTGIDISAPQIEIARTMFSTHPRSAHLRLICEDIYKAVHLLGRFDVIILRDVIEHISFQERFIPFLRRFLNPGGVVFIGFPPWQNPFGGHQQICNNRFLSHLPWFHLLPRSLYRKVLVWGGVPPEGLLDIKDTGLSLERFYAIVRASGFRIEKEQLYLINPNYETKFGLRPRTLWPFLQIPYIRNFYTTCGYFLLKEAL